MKINFSKNNEKPTHIAVFPDGTEISFCLLTLEEYSFLASYKEIKKLDDISFYEEVYNVCVPNLYKRLGGQIKAGIPYSIGQFIWTQSYSYDNLIEELDRARNNYDPSNIYEYMKSLIIVTYNNYKYEDFDKLNRLQIIDLFVRAEALAQQKNKDYKPLNLKKELRKQQRKESGIDFERDNREIAKEFRNNGQDQLNSMDLVRIREAAQVRHNNRMERMRNG